MQLEIEYVTLPLRWLPKGEAPAGPGEVKIKKEKVIKMSYIIIKKIHFDKKKKKFIATWAESNVRCSAGGGRCWYKDDDSFEMFDKIAQTKGLEEAEMHILAEYIDGNFQGGNNKYTHALQLLQHTPEAKPFISYKYYSQYGDKRIEMPEFRKWLKWALHTKLPEPRFVISKSSYINSTVYGKFTSRTVYWKLSVKEATKFRWKEDAEKIIGWFRPTVTKNWKIIEILQQGGKHEKR